MSNTAPQATITGARRGELVAIQFDCLDLDNKRIELRSNDVWSSSSASASR